MVATRDLYLGLVAAVAAERALELFISRAHARAARAAGGFEVGREHYPYMVAFHAAFLCASSVEVVVAERTAPALVAVVALAMVVVAEVLRYWALVTLGKRWNVRIIVWPNEPLVTSGPYRLMRHPNYVAVFLEVLFLPLVHGAWVSSLIFTPGNLLLLFVRIRSEERALGPNYQAVFGNTPRFWFRQRRA